MQVFDLVDSFVTIHQTVEKSRPGPRFHSTKSIATLLKDFGLTTSTQEEVWVIPIDGMARVRTIYQVAKGGFHEANVSVATILAPVLLAQTDRFVLAHNHPSGELFVSSYDLEITHRVSEAADLMELTFEDHVIVAPDGSFVSLYGKQLMRPPSKVASK